MTLCVYQVMTSVDKRLQSIQDELHAERLMLKKADKISGELKQVRNTIFIY